MCLVLPDEILRAAGVSEQEARVELACALFAAGRLSLWPAAQLAGLSRAEMEDALAARKIPVYRPTLEEVLGDAEKLRRAGF